MHTFTTFILYCAGSFNQSSSTKERKSIHIRKEKKLSLFAGYRILYKNILNIPTKKILQNKEMNSFKLQDIKLIYKNRQFVCMLIVIFKIN